MKYTSTRDDNVRVGSARAVIDGISADGGLYVPLELPKIDFETLGDDYFMRAERVLSVFFDFDVKTILWISSAQTPAAFTTSFVLNTSPPALTRYSFSHRFMSVTCLSKRNSTPFTAAFSASAMVSPKGQTIAPVGT